MAYWDSHGVDGKPQQRRYCIGGVDGKRVPSISTIAGVFEKPVLVPAAVKLQEEAVIALAQTGVDLAGMTQTELREHLVKSGGHYDVIWGEARQRGSIAHDALVHLIAGEKVDHDTFPQHALPWVSAAERFVRSERPEAIDVEYVVASEVHGFAGRGDLLCRLPDGRLARVDYKTVSKWSADKVGHRRPPYAENLLALTGYEIGAEESGYAASDVRWIVRLGPDGDYDITQSKAQPEDFLAALAAYRTQRRLAGLR